MMRINPTPISSATIRAFPDRPSRVAVVVGTRPEAIKMAPVVREQFDAVLVQGDTTTVVAAGLAATWAHIPVGHVEAGLRSFDLQHPFPEEMHRRLLGSLATWHFAPTPRARRNLLDEGVNADRVFTTGNTIVDALKAVDLSGDYEDAALQHLPAGRLITVTAHRRENHGAPLTQITQGIRTLTGLHPDLVFVLPMHPNPNVRAVLRDAFAHNPRVFLIEPLGYRDMLRLLDRSTLILTDSGGIQEEAPSLGTPVLIMRKVTERPEVVSSGAGRLVGTHADVIVGEVSRLLTDDVARRAMERAPNPFGDGLASERIADILELRLRGRISSGGRTADIGIRAADSA